jgi:hypothetical protein
MHGRVKDVAKRREKEREREGGKGGSPMSFFIFLGKLHFQGY